MQKRPLDTQPLFYVCEEARGLRGGPHKGRKLNIKSCVTKMQLAAYLNKSNAILPNSFQVSN